jgi:hypothetical protein
VAEQLHRMLEKTLEGGLIADVDIGQDVHALLGLGVTHAAQFLDDLPARLFELGSAACREQNAGAGDGEVATELQADTEAAAGDHRRASLVQTGQHALDGVGHAALPVAR